MGIFDRINIFKKRLDNSNTQKYIDIPYDDPEEELSEGKYFSEVLPRKMKPCVANYRYVRNNDPDIDSSIHTNIVTALSSFNIDGDKTAYDKEVNGVNAVDYIKELCVTEWDIRETNETMLDTGMTDGFGYIRKTIVDNVIKIGFMVFDGEENLVKDVYNEFGQYEGSMFVEKRNIKDLSKWKSLKDFDDLDEELGEVVTCLTKDEVIYYRFRPIRGQGRSMIKPLLSTIESKWRIEDMLPRAAYKKSELMQVTIGTKDKSPSSFPQNMIRKVVHALKSYHLKGTITVPYGMDAKMIGDSDLPKLQDYIEVLIKKIDKTLQTPASLFSSEGGNRSTAQVQIDSAKSPRQMMVEYLQQFLKETIEKELFEPQLELAGYGDVKVFFTFSPEVIEGQYLDDPQLSIAESPETDELPEDNNTTSKDEPVNSQVKKTPDGKTIIPDFKPQPVDKDSREGRVTR